MDTSILDIPLNIEALIQLAAGYQFREAGIVEHLRRISAYVTLLTGAMGWDEERVRLFKHAAVFHDVGMVDVPGSIVNKQGKLTDEETSLMQRHTELGRVLLEESDTPLLGTAAELAWCHHERYDGSGYPRKLKGRDIPQPARVLIVADVFDALTTDRPFKEAYPFDVAWEIVQAMSGSHFDPEVVEAMSSSRDAFHEACTSLASEGNIESKGFRISARDESGGELFSIASEGYFSCPFCRDLHPRTMDVCPDYEIDLSAIHKLSGLVVDDKYKLRGVIGVGGMGTVYEARHMLIDRTLAIKFLDPALARDEESLTRFSNEARVFSTVGHPNLVEVTDMGQTEEGIPYMVMELLEGTDLARLVQDHGRLAPITAVTITLEILRTLASVHAKGIIHRDLKPENVFLVIAEGQVRIKLLDFGISRLITGSKKDVRLTQKGIVFGTPQYMSPEQAHGKHDVDHRSDIFTVGEILYEMVTGKEVFSGDNSLTILSNVTKGRITPPTEITPEVPDEIEAVIMKALARDPKKRYQDAGEFMEPLLELARQDGRFEEGTILDLKQSHVVPVDISDLIPVVHTSLKRKVSMVSDE